MTNTIQVSVVEQTSIIQRIDEQAEREGLKRADILRRAIRQYVFLLSNNSIEGIKNAPMEYERVHQ